MAFIHTIKIFVYTVIFLFISMPCFYH
ncbi:hypothetical protein KPL50_13860 [Clostridium sp. CF012]|nr:hypothetical protein [Clostridium sp. CF012]